MMQKEINHPVLGMITYKKRIGNRYIRITINPVKGIIVSLPTFTTYSMAQHFVNSKLEEIMKIKEKQRVKFKEKVNNFGVNCLIETFGYQIKFAKHNASKVVAKISKDNMSGCLKQIITIWYPDIWPDLLSHGSNEWEIINSVYLTVIRREAKLILPIKTAKIAANIEEKAKSFDSVLGLLPRKRKSLNTLLFAEENKAKFFDYNAVTIKNNRTNWGSCSTKNNINLNMHLVELPEELIDFVITHELCHLVYHNHGDNFHRLLNALCNGREKELADLLKQNRMN